jgi:hypothetical protein
VSLVYFFYINNMIRIVLRHESINLYKCDYIFGWEDYTLMRSFSCRSEKFLGPMALAQLRMK